MNLALDALLALLAGFLTDYVESRVGVSEPIRGLVAVLVGIVVFFAHFSTYAR